MKIFFSRREEDSTPHYLYFADSAGFDPAPKESGVLSVPAVDTFFPQKNNKTTLAALYLYTAISTIQQQ